MDWGTVLLWLGGLASAATVVAAIVQLSRPVGAWGHYEGWAKVKADATSDDEREIAESQRRAALVRYVALSRTRSERIFISVFVLVGAGATILWLVGSIFAWFNDRVLPVWLGELLRSVSAAIGVAFLENCIRRPYRRAHAEVLAELYPDDGKVAAENRSGSSPAAEA